MRDPHRACAGVAGGHQAVDDLRHQPLDPLVDVDAAIRADELDVLRGCGRAADASRRASAAWSTRWRPALDLAAGDEGLLADGPAAGEASGRGERDR